MVSVITTGFGAAAIDGLSRILREQRADNPLAPAVVVSSGPLVSVGVRRALGRRPGGVAGVWFTTLGGLAEHLADGPMAAAGCHLASDIEVQVGIRAELSARPGLFGRVADHRTTEEHLVALHHQVAGMGDEALARLEEAESGLAEDAFRVLRGASRRLGTSWDRDQLSAVARDELDQLPANSLGPIILFLPEPAGPFDGLLISALVRRADCHVIVGLSGEPLVDRRHLERLAAWNIQVDDAQPVPMSAAHLIEVADPDDEVRTAVRAVAAHAALGVPLARMAILYPTADPYATLLSEQLDGAAIPWGGPGHRPLAASLAGRFLLRLFELKVAGLERAAVMALVASAPLSDDRGDPVPVYVWDRLSRQAGVVNDEHWAPRLTALAEQLGPEDGTEIQNLGRFVDDLRERLLPHHSTWASWGVWARDLLRQYLAPMSAASALAPTAEQAAAANIEAALDRLTVLDGHGDEPDFATFSSIMATQLEKRNVPGPAFETGLVVAPLGSVTGLEFERVVVVGLAEGIFPRTPREDALLPDRVRAESGGMLARTETITDLDVRVVAASLGASRQTPLVVTARGDLRSIRSRSWPRELNAVIGERTVIESHHRGLADHGRPASLEDFRLRALIDHVDGGDPVHTHELANQDEVLDRNLQRILARQRGDLNRHVGRVPAGALDVTERLLSATALEDYASCPRRYLLGRVLRLGDDERPEQIDEITPMERGTLIHAVLERFIDASITAGAVPEPSEAWSSEARLELLAILDAELNTAQARGITGGRVNTLILRRRLAIEMELFVETDNALRAERRSTPVRVELDFGFDDEPSEVELPDGRRVRLRGRVDRVDTTEDGGVLVIDYKGGSGRAFVGMAEDPLDGGRRLQLPLYARIVAEKLDRDGPRTALYWLTRHGDIKPMELEEQLESDLNRTVSAALDGISGGLFPGVPGEAIGWPRLTFENCRYCDFDRICPTDRQREWDGIRNDPALTSAAPLLGGQGDQ